ncbi:hypothetical protein F443_18303 [Phytophthora nicotianae P1569]|uniref:Uncharacterized protein n=1 Tax=Phytophthora nicotianae P1569 TaxID=1317065 RepID=V9E8R0_PHYNI|nr:hypothetical protein F443_18303 [Phytophthora nicotianae P1569]
MSAPEFSNTKAVLARLVGIFICYKRKRVYYPQQTVVTQME